MCARNLADSWKIAHTGTHNHPLPPWKGKLDFKLQAALTKIIQDNPEATPSQLTVGTASQQPVRNIHPSLANHNKLKFERNTILGKFIKNLPFLILLI